MKSRLFVFALAIVSTVAATADTLPYPQAGAYAPVSLFQAAADGDVIAYFYDSTGMFTEEIGLYVNGVQQGNWALANHASSFGDAVNFGAVHAGDKLTFVLNVQDTGYTLSSDPRENADFINHAYAAPLAGETRDGVVVPSGVYLGFEDSLLPFTDLNYHDEDIVVTNVIAAATPEPASFALIAAGLIGATVFAGKRSKL